jgi:hypothetical protein
MRVCIKSLVQFFKQEVFPIKDISVRFVKHLPKDEHGHEFSGQAIQFDDGSFLVKVRNNLTHSEQIETLIHEMAHVSRGIPKRGDGHDARFFEHLGHMQRRYYDFLRGGECEP